MSFLQVKEGRIKIGKSKFYPRIWAKGFTSDWYNLTPTEKADRGFGNKLKPQLTTTEAARLWGNGKGKGNTEVVHIIEEEAVVKKRKVDVDFNIYPPQMAVHLPIKKRELASSDTYSPQQQWAQQQHWAQQFPGGDPLQQQLEVADSMLLLREQLPQSSPFQQQFEVADSMLLLREQLPQPLPFQQQQLVEPLVAQQASSQDAETIAFYRSIDFILSGDDNAAEWLIV
jgi:hypothetical protein